MLTAYFKSASTIARYRAGSAGPHLDRFVDWLVDQGYRRASIRRHVREVVNFAAWAESAGLGTAPLNHDARSTARPKRQPPPYISKRLRFCAFPGSSWRRRAEGRCPRGRGASLVCRISRLDGHPSRHPQHHAGQLPPSSGESTSNVGAAGHLFGAALARILSSTSQSDPAGEVQKPGYSHADVSTLPDSAR